METGYLADPEKSADGSEELYLSFVLPAALLSVSAVEICRQTIQSSRPSYSHSFDSRGGFINLPQSVPAGERESL